MSQRRWHKVIKYVCGLIVVLAIILVVGFIVYGPRLNIYQTVLNFVSSKTGFTDISVKDSMALYQGSTKVAEFIQEPSLNRSQSTAYFKMLCSVDLSAIEGSSVSFYMNNEKLNASFKSANTFIHLGGSCTNELDDALFSIEN